VAAGLFNNYTGCSNKVYARIPVPVGTHVLESPVGFAAYVFGTGVGESYAFAAHNIGAPVVVNDTVICSDGPITLTAPEPLDNAIWYALSDPGTTLGTGNSLTLTPTTNDTLVVSGDLADSGCPKEYIFPVGVPVPAFGTTANGAATITVCQYTPVQLALDPAPDPGTYTIQWSPATTLSDATIPDPVALPQQDTWYTVTVSSPLGCGDQSDSVLVQVLPSPLYKLAAESDADAVCQGNSVALQASTEQVLFADALDAAPGPLWNDIQGGAVSTTCGAVTGAALLFDGGGQRSATTVPMDLSNGSAIYFDLFIAGPGSPCDDAQPGEDVVLEYSTNGVDWDLLVTYDEGAFPDFTNMEVPLSGPALSPTTRLRWRQLANSGAGQDVWALDNVIVTHVDPTGIGFQWNPAADLDDANSAVPNAVPSMSNWFTVVASHTGTGCSLNDSVFIAVEPPFSLSLTPDTSICDVAGIQLDAAPSSGNGITFLCRISRGQM
jgi:hypothetical protein